VEEFEKGFLCSLADPERTRTDSRTEWLLNVAKELRKAFYIANFNPFTPFRDVRESKEAVPIPPLRFGIVKGQGLKKTVSCSFVLVPFTQEPLHSTQELICS
jgi:hypothetical protein